MIEALILLSFTVVLVGAVVVLIVPEGIAHSRQQRMDKISLSFCRLSDAFSALGYAAIKAGTSVQQLGFVLGIQVKEEEK